MKLHMTTAACAMALAAAAPALAQSAAQYDPIMAKRADLRVQFIRAQQEAASAETGIRLHKSAVASGALQDFLSLLPKRADLRARVASMGMDAAYQDWLERQR